jgi:hypothetical protein
MQRHNRGKTQWTIKSFILESSHIMILNSTKFGGNWTNDVEVGPERRTDRPDPNMKMCTLVGYPGPLSFTPVMLLWP